MAQRKTHLIPTAIALSLAAHASTSVAAIDLYQQNETRLSANFMAVYGFFNSRHNYDNQPGGSHWREGFLKYGLNLEQGLNGLGSLYSTVNMVSSGTWGDGDAGGNTDGSERTTKYDEAFVGWRSGELLPWLGKDGLDLSFGRQIIALGDGFIINDDGLNPGKNAGDGSLNRGGAYYLAARHAFDKTAVLKLGGSDGWHGSALWFKSDNPIQADTEMAGATLDYSATPGTLGLTYLHGISVNDRQASDFLKQREGMNVYSLRGSGDAGIQNAHFSGEFAWQDKDAGNEKAWYGEAGYTFTSLPWQPDITYRYSRYSKNWDSLFNGFSRGYGTWFQGEVASNYAGPFNTNTAIQHLGLKAKPMESLTLGVLYFSFDTLHTAQTTNLDGQELDLYVEWAANERLTVTPLLGLYKPKHDANDGGLQTDGNGSNLYSQLTVALTF